MNNSTITPNVTEADGSYQANTQLSFTAATGIAIVFSVIGLIGNFIVFWYLCFKIKKNKYTIYIINLSVADFIFLLFNIVALILFIHTLTSTNPQTEWKEPFLVFLEIFSKSGQYSGMYILTALSLERCLSVLFPIWYHCQRPNNLSIIICVSVWILGCTESLIDNLGCPARAFYQPNIGCTAVQIIVFGLAIVICLPIMVISSFILLFKIKRTFDDQYPQKFYIIIIVAVCVFIISVIPINFVWFFMYFKVLKSDFETVGFFFGSMYCLVLHCTIDPYIYFIIGNKWKKKSSHSIKDALERAFRTEDDENDDSNSNKTSNISNQSNLASAL
ncbi:proto-oncogene Mas-like isoform X2 [Bufo bufo]|uniref:proto-oncogene Mas-like isoform X2 n=1 Tax=Bufo bufo TaxID=8384 RepID=UPI001ABDD934|nr:proto-oncogene Mas-like isoform X2 [Bufo bufo]